MARELTSIAKLCVPILIVARVLPDASGPTAVIWPMSAPVLSLTGIPTAALALTPAPAAGVDGPLVGAVAASAGTARPNDAASAAEDKNFMTILSSCTFPLRLREGAGPGVGSLVREG